MVTLLSQNWQETRDCVKHELFEIAATLGFAVGDFDEWQSDLRSVRGSLEAIAADPCDILNDIQKDRLRQAWAAVECAIARRELTGLARASMHVDAAYRLLH